MPPQFIAHLREKKENFDHERWLEEVMGSAQRQTKSEVKYERALQSDGKWEVTITTITYDEVGKTTTTVETFLQEGPTVSKTFHGFDTWRKTYEPSRKDREASAEAPAKTQEEIDKETKAAEAKLEAKKKLVSKILHKIAEPGKQGIVKFILEICSKLLGTVETALRQHGKKVDILPESTSGTLEAGKKKVQEIIEIEGLAASVLNCINGIVLSYRFEYKQPAKFQYIRGVAVDNLLDNVAELLRKPAAMAQCFASSKVGEALGDAQERAMSSLDVLEAKVCHELEQLVHDAEQLTEQLPFLSPNLPFDLPGTTSESAAELTAGAKQLAQVLKAFVKGKAQEMVSALKVNIQQMFVILRAAESVLSGISTKIQGVMGTPLEQKAALRAKVLRECEKKYQEMCTTIDTYLDVLLSMVDSFLLDQPPLLLESVAAFNDF
eukprot:gene16991-20200_t